VLGAGAFGEVEQREWGGARVAVKVNGLHADHAAALRTEVALYERLRDRPHPNILPVMGVCSDAPDGRVRLVMKCCERGSLEGLLVATRGKVGASACWWRSRACGL
jgi:hypothetical protein